MTEPRDYPQYPPVPEKDEIIVDDLISWYEGYITELETALDLCKKDKAAIRLWVHETESLYDSGGR